MTPRLPLFGMAAAALGLAGCGNTTVKLELTDAPPDLTTLDHVFLSIAAAQAHVVGGSDQAAPDENEANDHATPAAADDEASEADAGGSWRNVTPPLGSYDLLALRNDVRASLGQFELPSGKITQIRLFLDPQGDNRVVTSTGESCAIDLSKVPTTGFKINHPFKALDVTDASELRIVVDFDLGASLDQSGPCAFSLSPVIKLKRVEKD